MAAVLDYFSVGSIVWCRTCFQEIYEGEVMAFDPHMKLLMLKCASSSGDAKLHNVKFLNLTLIADLKVIKENTNVPDPPQSINLQRLNQRVRNQSDRKRSYMEAISANVSTEGQNLFIAIAKQIKEVRWRNSEIIVWNQDVIIGPPYALENIRGDTKSKEYLYIKKVVEKYMKDVAMNSQNTPVQQHNTTSSQ